MLYDKRWDAKVDVRLSLPDFVAWLETQDPERRYEWADCAECACARYMKDRFGNPFHWPHEREALETLAQFCGPKTYGALLNAARAALAAQ